MRNLIIALILLLGIIFVFVNIAEVEAIAETLQRGDWPFLALAVGVQAVWILNIAALFRTIYRSIGLEESIEKLFLLVAAMNFVNVVAPSGGMGGITIFIQAARRNGYSAARVAVAGVLAVLSDYCGFLCVLFLGLIVLVRRNNLNSVELIASGLLVLAAGVLASILYVGMRSESAMSRLLVWMAHRVNRLLWPFTHREYLSEERATSFAQEAAAGLAQLRQKPENLWLPVALGISNKALLISILFLVFMAFKVPFSVGTLIAGFSIGYLFLIVSPTPAGIGFMEGALTLGLRSLNVPLGDATVIAMAYRGITLWLPLFYGMIAFRVLIHTPNKKPST